MCKAEQRACWDLFKQNERKHQIRRYKAFRRQVRYSSLVGCWTVLWCGMLIGIEKDGNTHS